MKCVILHTVCNFMHTLCNSTQIYAVLSRGLFCRKFTHFSGLKMCGCKKMTNIRYGSTPNVLREVPQKALSQKRQMDGCSNQLLIGNPYMSCFKYIQMDVPKSQIHRYKEWKYKITQIQDMASLNCLQNIYNTMYE